jgi:hypothetical protein
VNPRRKVKKTGIVFVDIEWRDEEMWGPRRIVACWNVENPGDKRHPFVKRVFPDALKAVEWARKRSHCVLVRYGPTEEDCYTAGDERLTHSLDDPTPFPEWRPDIANPS